MRPLKLDTQEQINRSAHRNVDIFLEQDGDFVLKEDPLLQYHEVFCPIKCCSACGHKKYMARYTYKRWDTAKKKLSHFGLIMCDKCGYNLSWINKHLRDALIKKNQIDLND
jgi:Zn ribbon nucleic-acid-binding protein